MLVFLLILIILLIKKKNTVKNIPNDYSISSEVQIKDDKDDISKSVDNFRNEIDDSDTDLNFWI